jgi:hypothetical protein
VISPQAAWIFVLVLVLVLECPLIMPWGVEDEDESEDEDEDEIWLRLCCSVLFVGTSPGTIGPRITPNHTNVWAHGYQLAALWIMLPFDCRIAEHRCTRTAAMRCVFTPTLSLGACLAISARLRRRSVILIVDMAGGSAQWPRREAEV